MMNETHRYRKLLQFGSILLRKSKPGDLQEALFEKLPEIIDIDGLALFIKADKERWTMRAASRNALRLKSIRPRLKQYAKKMNGGAVAAPLVIDRRRKRDGKGFSIVAAFPLMIMDKATAFLVAARASGSAFTSEDLYRLDYVAAILSTTMENQYVVRKLKNQATCLVEEKAHLEAHNRVLLETLPDGLFRVNDRFEVVEVNRYAAAAMGLDPKTIIGRKCYETICTESHESCPIFSEGRDAVTYETTIPVPGKEPSHVLKSIQRYRLGAGEYALETIKDITPLKQMEKKVRDYAENLEKKVMKRTAELKEAQAHLFQSEKLAATGRLAASLAHEINNPIYGIRGCLQSILDELDLKDELKHFVKLSLQETERISDLVRRMQTFQWDARGERRLEDVTTILKDVLFLNNKLLKERKIILQVCFNANLPRASICADEMKQVFFNLINNAMESMPKGGRLTIATASRGATVEIEFTDTGAGMPKEVKERIFDAFFTTKSAVKGVGLGLPVCWGIIRGHGGRILVDSEEGKGSSFVVVLPAAKSQDSQEDRKTAAAE